MKTFDGYSFAIGHCFVWTRRKLIEGLCWPIKKTSKYSTSLASFSSMHGLNGNLTVLHCVFETQTNKPIHWLEKFFLWIRWHFLCDLHFWIFQTAVIFGKIQWLIYHFFQNHWLKMQQISDFLQIRKSIYYTYHIASHWLLFLNIFWKYFNWSVMIRPFCYNMMKN